MAVTKKTTFAESAISIENNTSTLKITIKFSPNNDVTYFSSKSLKCTCNGTQKTATVSLSKGGSVSKTFTFSGISHNQDGSKTVSWSWSCATGTSVLGTISDSGTKKLTTIPRASEITSASSGTTPYYPVIKWTPKSSDFKYKIQIYYSSGELYASSDIISPNQTTEYTYSSLKIENNYFNSIIDTDVSTFKVKLTTYQSDGTTEIGSNELNNISVSLDANKKPTFPFGFGYAEIDAKMLELNWGVFVKNKSKLEVTYAAQGPHSSLIKKMEVITNNQTIVYEPTTPTNIVTHTFNTNVLTTIGTNDLSIRPTDSRGRSSLGSIGNYNVVDYSEPVITTAEVKRVNASNVEDDEGEYISYKFVGEISSVSNHNDKLFRIGYRVKGSNTSFTYKTISSSYTVNATSYTRITDWTLSSSNAYEIVFEAIDSFRTASNPVKQTRYIETGKPLMNFNASGKAMAIGKVSEAGANEELLEIALPTRFIPNTDVYNSIEIDSSNRNEASIAYFNQAKDKAYVVGYGTASFDGFGIYSAETTKNVMTVDKDGNGIFTNSFQTANYGLNGDFGLTRIFREMLGSSTGAEDADLDNFYDTGIYRCYPSTSHKPDVDISGFATYGICIVIKSYDWWYQIYIGNWGTPRIATRIKTGTNNWETWVGI